MLSLTEFERQRKAKAEGAAADKVSTRVISDEEVRQGALTDPALRGAIPLLGLNLNATSEKAMRLLGWTPRPREEAILATAESLVRLGLLARG